MGDELYLWNSFFLQAAQLARQQYVAGTSLPLWNLRYLHFRPAVAGPLGSHCADSLLGDSPSPEFVSLRGIVLPAEPVAPRD